VGHVIFSHINPQPSTSITLINTTTTNVPLCPPPPGTSATTSATTHDMKRCCQTTTRCRCHATSHGCEEGGDRGHGEGKWQGVQGVPTFFIYLFYLLMPYYSSPTPEHEKRACQCVFRVPRLPFLIHHPHPSPPFPCSPSHGSRHPQDMENMP